MPLDNLEPIRPVKPFPAQKDARVGYFDLFEEDAKLQEASQEAFAEPLTIVDDLLAYVYEIIIVIYDNVDKWQDDVQRRLVHAALNAAFNDLLLARTISLRGYFYDAQLTFRSAQEWSYRAILFHEDADSVEEFIDKGFISDEHVRERIEAIFDARVSGSGAAISRRFAKLYHRRSSLGHANLQSLALRAYPRAPIAKSKNQRREMAKSLGTGALVGGYSTREIGFAAMIDLMAEAEALLQVCIAQIPGDTRDLKARHAALRLRAEKQTTKLKTQIDSSSQED